VPKFAVIDSRYADETPAETLAKHPQQIETWLTMVETLIRQIKREQLDPKHSRTIDIREYFKQPSYNIRVREIQSKKMKDVDIRKFFQPPPQPNG